MHSTESVWALSKEGTLLIPVMSRNLWSSRETTVSPVLYDGTKFWPKAELHVTVIGYGTGKLVVKAIKAIPYLKEVIETIAEEVSWAFDMTESRYVLSRGKTKTIVAPIAIPGMGYFYKRMAALTSGFQGCEALMTAMKNPPPPHITIYTNDPDGKKAIGLNTVDELATALNAEENGEALSARQVPPEKILTLRSTQEQPNQERA